MRNDKMAIGDTVNTALTRSRPVDDKNQVRANVHAVLRSADGDVKFDEWGENLVSDFGDSVIAARLYDNAENIVTGMKLGTGSTAAAKNGAGADLVTYISGSQEALDAVASDATKGAGAGWRTTYVCTWVAGDVTNAAIAEVVLTNQTALADNAGNGTNLARYVFGAAIDKQAGDSLEVTWQIDILGA